MRDWNAVAIGAPAGVLIALLAGALVLAAGGRNPIWPDHELTLSEAVAVVDDADIELLIGRGVDPNAAYGVRPGLLSDRPQRLTPLETAVLSHRADLIERLVDKGAVMTATVWIRLRCLAQDDERVSAALDRYRPVTAGSWSCEGISAP